jgi:hypothetical protein
MSVRGGNGYIEEWPNGRLLRDAHLGAIWEGTSSVVALDVQRAVLKDGGLDALAGYAAERLGTVREAPAAEWARRLEAAFDGVRRRVDAWPGLDGAERELDARPTAETLYHLFAASLLLAEGERLMARRRRRPQAPRRRAVRAPLARGALRPRLLERGAPLARCTPRLDGGPGARARGHAMIDVRTWGTTEAERRAAYPADRYLEKPRRRRLSRRRRRRPPPKSRSAGSASCASLPTATTGSITSDGRARAR